MNTDGDLCPEFIQTGRCGHSDAEHDALADAETLGGGGLTAAEKSAIFHIVVGSGAFNASNVYAAVERIVAARVSAAAVRARAEVVARVEALADEWEALGFGTSIYESAGELAQILRAALAGPNPREDS